MDHHHIYELKTSAGTRSVKNALEPVSSFKTVPGFFNIAHRGASFYAPENTFPAFQKAVAMNADMIELDVTLSRDQVPLVFHDRKLHRTTNGTGEIRNYYEHELRDLDAGFWFDPDFKGVQIPRLEEVFEWASGKIALNIEIKKEAIRPERKNGIVQLIYELVTEYKMSEQVIISSFSDEALRRLRKLSSEIPTAYLISPYSLGTPKVYYRMKNMNANGLNVKPGQMRHRLMKLTNKSRVPVWVYTVDDKQEITRVINKGATGIFTNRPDLVGQVAHDVLSNHQD